MTTRYDEPSAVEVFDTVKVYVAARAEAVSMASNAFEPLAGSDADFPGPVGATLLSSSLLKSSAPCATYIVAGSKACHCTQSEAMSFVLRSVKTFAHQMPLPSYPRSHICASANSDPDAHASFRGSVIWIKLFAPVLSVHTAQIAIQTMALERRECSVGVPLYARIEVTSAISGRAS